MHKAFIVVTTFTTNFIFLAVKPNFDNYNTKLVLALYFSHESLKAKIISI
jgi:hypothetical protein